MIRIRKNKKATTYQVYLRYKDKYGCQKSYSKSGFKKIREAQRHEKEMLKIIDSGNQDLNCFNSLTFNDVFLEYMSLSRKKYAISTYKTYFSKFNTHIKNSIGKYLIHMLGYKETQDFFNQLGDKNSKALNLDIKKIFSVTFNYAIKCNYIVNNPMHLIEVTGIQSNPRKKTISFYELNQLVENLINPNNRINDYFQYYSFAIALYIGYYTGLRISETLALEKNDIDFINEQIIVSKRLESKDTERGLYVTSKLKTTASRATIPMCNPLKIILEEWFQFNENDLICCKKNGDYLRYEEFDRVTSKIAKKHGFNFHSHMLRHTFSTNLIKNDVSPKVASELARHSQVSTTLDVYVHPNKADMKTAIKKTFKS